MTFTITFSELSLFLAAIAFFILVIYLIPAIIQFRNTAKALEDFSQKGKEACENVSTLVHRINTQTDEVSTVVKKFTELGRDIAHLADIVVSQLKGPIITLVSVIAGIEFAFKHLKRKEGDKDVRE